MRPAWLGQPAGFDGEPHRRGHRAPDPSAPAIAVFISTPSAPSSMATAASEAVPTPASTITGTLACSLMMRMLFGILDAEPGADRRAERHHRRGARVLELAAHHRIVVGVGQHDEAFLDQRRASPRAAPRCRGTASSRRRSPRASPSSTCPPRGPAAPCGSRRPRCSSRGVGQQEDLRRCRCSRAATPSCAMMFTRRTATVTMSAPDASCAACMIACDGYLPVPTIRREEKVRPAITRNQSFCQSAIDRQSEI